LIITRSLTAKLKDSRKYYKDTNNKTTFLEAVKRNLYELEKVFKGKSKRLD